MIVLFLVTLGFYALFWIYRTFAELRRYRGGGVGGLGGLFLGFVGVSTFLLPSYVGRAYHEDGQQPPITGWAGFWVFVPFIGSFVWLAKIQGALNRFWQGKEAHALASAPGEAVAGVPQPPAAGQQQPAAGQQQRAAHLSAELHRPAPAETGADADALSAATLLFKDGPLAGRRFPIAARLMLGRENADIVVEDPEVSRQHALMRWGDGRLELSDLRSANGTFLNRERISGPRELHDGDVVRIGQTSIVVELPPARDPAATVLRPR
jgi:FHA domain/Domain of unknown function (DUF4234)